MKYTLIKCYLKSLRFQNREEKGLGPSQGFSEIQNNFNILEIATYMEATPLKYLHCIAVSILTWDIILKI